MDAGFLPLSFRYFFLQAHYRKQQTFNDDAMAAADTGYRRLVAQAQALPEGPPEEGTDPERMEAVRQSASGAPSATT